MSLSSLAPGLVSALMGMMSSLGGRSTVLCVPGRSQVLRLSELREAWGTLRL